MTTSNGKRKSNAGRGVQRNRAVCCFRPEITGELLAVTHEDDFTVPELRAIYKAAEKLFTVGRPVDAVTIRGICGAAYKTCSCSAWT